MSDSWGVWHGRTMALTGVAVGLALAGETWWAFALLAASAGLRWWKGIL